jgi:hypothetical protein
MRDHASFLDRLKAGAWFPLMNASLAEGAERRPAFADHTIAKSRLDPILEPLTIGFDRSKCGILYEFSRDLDLPERL